MVNGRRSGEEEQLWGEGEVHIFISHKAEDKDLATQLKDRLSRYGIASFVAHEDIRPMSEWQDEMERALFSMDVLVALLTDGFSDSDWTDQEVGVAVGRSVPVVPVRIGKDPYGSMGKYQALRGHTNAGEIAVAVFEWLLDHDELQPLATDAFISAIAQSPSYAASNNLATYLPAIRQLSSRQVRDLLDAFNGNSQVYRSFGFGGSIVEQLRRLTGNDYMIVDDELVMGSPLEELPW